MRSARKILSEIANRYGNSDLRMDHPEVEAVIDGLIKEADRATMAIPPFESPAPLALMAEFVKRYGNNTVYFERDLHRMIGAFVENALKPWQQALTDAAMKSASPMYISIKEPFDPGRPPERRLSIELWRGQHSGDWYRLVLSDSCRLELQRSSGMDISPEHECWNVEWVR